MSTFIEDDKQKKEIPKPVKDKDDKDKPKTPFEIYVEGLNEQYVAKCKEMAQKTSFRIAIREGDNDVEKTFTRKHLTQGQLDEIEDLRIEAQDLTESEKGSKKQRAANTKWYSTIGSYILYDGTKKQFMTEADFKNAVNKDIKPILDGCIMAEMAGVPN
jgi:hypothetical protein